jgi:pilus assembly protein Flp/PilA
MMRLYARIRGFIEDSSGATAIEYGLIAGLIALAAISSFVLIGGSLESTFEWISQQLAGVAALFAGD